MRQTYSNIEVLVIDDGSSDNTLRVSQSYADKDSRVKVFHQENAGVSAARNYGIREARGDYMIFLDSDDWLDYDTVKFLLDVQAEHPDKLIATGHYDAYISSDGRILRSKVIHPANELDVSLYEAISDKVKIAIPSSCYKLYKTEIIQKNNIHFREGIINHEDGLFVFEYVNKTEGIYFIDQALWNILVRPGSACNSGYTHKMTHSAIEADKIMLNYPDNTQEMRALLIYRNARFISAFLNNAIRSKQPKDEIDYIRREGKLYLHEYFSLKNVSLMRKILLALKFTLPIPIVKLFIIAIRGLRKKNNYGSEKYEEVRF